MSSAIQNRLAGTAILMALAAIFLPDILDGQKQSNKDQFVELPQRPSMREVGEAQPFPTDEVKRQAIREVEIVNEQPVDEPASEMMTTQDMQASDTSTSASEDTSLAQETVIDTNPEQRLQSAGWVVQLGVFRHEKNVQELLGKLKSAGYRAFSRPVETSSGTLTKVFVGPDLQKDKLEKAVPHLNELTNLQGRITPFTVN